MLIKIEKASDYGKYPGEGGTIMYRNFEKVEELYEFMRKCRNTLIIGQDIDGSPHIAIYDDYIE
jgi:hypothetical protein